MMAKEFTASERNIAIYLLSLRVGAFNQKKPLK